ncbi:hypothetical protein [Trinickia mobilis]|uniref:hypothetical protein n=1 Tax=Trinickia mobilis TaxID=2816356 RepID=UPI001A8E2EA8|nr:hypothetical protein [Trinickia mobilis]
MTDRSRGAIGMAWFANESDYERMRVLLVDGETLTKPFDEWQKDAETMAKRYAKDTRARVVCVYIDPDTFPAWCRARGLVPDRAACNKFADEKAPAVAAQLDVQNDISR